MRYYTHLNREPLGLGQSGAHSATHNLRDQGLPREAARLFPEHCGEHGREEGPAAAPAQHGESSSAARREPMPRPPNNAAQDAGTEPTHLARAHRDRCSTAGVRGVWRATRMRGVRRATRMRGVRRATRMRGVRRATRMRGVRRATRMRGAWPGLPGGSLAPPAPGWASPWAAPGQSGRSTGGERAEAGAALEGRCRGTQAGARGQAGGVGPNRGQVAGPACLGRIAWDLKATALGSGRLRWRLQLRHLGGRSAAAAPGLALLPSGLGVHCAARSHRFYSYSVIPAGLRAWRITVALSHLRCPQTAENIIFLKSATIFPVTSYNCMPKAGTVAGQGASFLLWKVCRGAECKPSLCSRLGQWPPGVTLLWEWKPSLVALDLWAVCPALASGRELVRQVSTNIIERNANLEWNQVVNLQIKFPSMCEKIKLKYMTGELQVCWIQHLRVKHLGTKSITSAPFSDFAILLQES
ncbi:uncharacterized protein LOC127676134 [Apodemus sylvaticus]|uniref:uncharacterized protein LOC127676134 n=1 Tax=Apodemus sylvaticus TaxID=10129 RepID=UPI002242242F|nr:uncharacterized protein LOC127676134 [Apodemus sylvaticus]